MKINEIANIEAEELFESLSNDSDHSFSEETLKQISEDVINADFSEPAMSVDEFIEWMFSQ